MEVYEDNGSWMWVAFAPVSRLIVAFTSVLENNMLQMNWLS